MSFSEDIIEGIKKEIQLKERDRDGILDRIALIDIELDKFDQLISSIDADAYSYIPAINNAVNDVKKQYDARLNAGCRNNTVWEIVDQYCRSSFYENQNIEVCYYQYEVKYDGGPPSSGHGNGSGAYGHTPYHGLKYYQKPSNRDYGANLIREFQGFCEPNSLVIGFTTSQGFTKVPNNIKTEQTVVDNLVNPEFFSVGDLPKIVGTGVTSIVSITTSLIGGITSGSNTFLHFGGGITTMTSVGMAFLNPKDDAGIGTPFDNGDPPIITGFGTATYTLQFYDSVGILTTSIIDINTIILDKTASEGIAEATFEVGIVTTAPALFLSTATKVGSGNTTFYVLDQESDIDKGFDIFANPNSPVKIGSLGSGNLGVGHSVYYDDFGDPNSTESWKPETAFNPDDYNVDDSEGVLKEVKEPYVGAGRADYWVGNSQWPTLTTTTATQVGMTTQYTTVTNYAPLGTKVTIGGTQSSVSIGYVAISAQNPSNCGNLDNDINNAENDLNSIISQNKSKAEGIIGQSMTLRKRRSDKELQAWSLLQASSRTFDEIEELKKQLQSLQNTDLSKFDK
jgi:hypothetical protein